VTQEQDLLDLLEEYRPKLEELENTVLGYTKVFLEGGNICRMRECNLGNLVTDAMVYARVVEASAFLNKLSPDAIVSTE